MKILSAALACLTLTACATTPPQSAPLQAQTQGYTPLSRALESTEGYLEINAKTATFSLREGTMNLTYANVQVPPAAADASWFKLEPVYFYKVTNATAYFNANKGGNGMGQQPTEWLAIARTADDGLSLCLGHGPFSLDPNLPNLNACGVYLKDAGYPDNSDKNLYQ